MICTDYREAGDKVQSVIWDWIRSADLPGIIRLQAKTYLGLAGFEQV